MRAFRLIPDDTRIRFMRYEYWAYAFSAALILLTLILVPLKGLNFGIDFRGGILIEVRMPGAAADLGGDARDARRARAGRGRAAGIRAAVRRADPGPAPGRRGGGAAGAAIFYVIYLAQFMLVVVLG